MTTTSGTDQSGTPLRGGAQRGTRPNARRAPLRRLEQVWAMGRAIADWGAATGADAGGSSRRAHLPWRSTRDPWAVLVSEVMSQQTQLSRVVPAYQRFLEQFPTPAACAGASLGDVLRAWEGLGYNRRARSLHRAARLMVADHVDVLLLLDQRLTHPGRVSGVLDHHSQLALRRHETVAREASPALGAVLEFHVPLRRPHTPALQETDLALQRVGVLAGPGVRHVRYGPVDGVQTEAVEKL